ncbi:hypothetical protein PYW07_012808 [Mythimna separata]|uniref:Peptidase S1 domain-containing protein n=1 Tax=Mythimna separata TaxID=271217 RepID=A0AAD8DL60_MYTSE|nr:hypothetical protein PYW07_012808 [Mythimna separata]
MDPCTCQDKDAIMGASYALKTLLVLTVITVARGQTQYFDILQGLQQLFQPYPGNGYNNNQFNGPTRAPAHRQSNRQEVKKKTVEQRVLPEERRTRKPPPTNQFEYVFATTEKPSRKTTKTNSSQNNSRSFNNKNEYSNILFGEFYNPYEITTKAHRNRVKTTTTTEAYSFNYPNRGTTQNVFGNFNGARPVTENVFQTVNQRETFATNNQPKPANLINNGASFDFNNNNFGNRPQSNGNNNNNQGTFNTNSNINFQSRPANDRNNNGFLNTDFNPGFNTGSNGFNRPNFGNSEVNFNTNTNDRVTNNNGGNSGFNSNTNRPANNFNGGNSNNFNPSGFYYPPDNPVINQQGVIPAIGNINQPPITNRPVTTNNNFVNFNRPSDSSTVTFTGQSNPEPEILIGPDEDDMTDYQKRRFADKAERMCEYYRSLTVKKVVALPLLPSSDGREFNVSDCTPINVPLIIGGTVASIRDFPHMAIVGWMKAQEPGYSWKCGGSLISDRYVLTAGHCTYQDKDANVQSGPPQAVQLGSSYLDDPGAIVVRISAVIRHPKYKMRRSYHDVALIKMVSKVKFSEVIRPACLGVPPPEGRSVIATGWGRTEYGGDHSLQLRSVSLNVWSMRECQDIWGTSLKLPNGVTPDSHMCAGERSGGKDTCQGDSGGPAQIQDGCLWRVVAVTSYGRSCGAPDTPALYAGDSGGPAQIQAGCLWRVVGVTSYGRSCGAPDTPALYAVIPHAFVAAQVFSDSSPQ